VVDIFDAVGLEKPNIGLLDEEFLAQVKNLPERNLDLAEAAIELVLQQAETLGRGRLGAGYSKYHRACSVGQSAKFGEAPNC
jgi:type I restriction enzyme R subunit